MHKGKVAIVTGSAGKGMGRSIALTLARDGANVVVNYRTNEGEASAIVRYIEEQGGKAMAFQADVSLLDQCYAMVDAAIKKFDHVDICIINPGAGWNPENIEKLDPLIAMDDITKEMSPFYNLIKSVLPRMSERQWGRIIGISMNLSTKSPSFSYDAAKAARTQAILRAAPDVWVHGITVNVVAPGPVENVNDLQGAIELCEHKQKWIERTNITPQDVAEGVSMLCSESARFITGCELKYSYYR